MKEEIEVIPLDRTNKVKMKILTSRPSSCPDKTCKPLLMSPPNIESDLEKGYSGNCFGYCGKKEFGFKDVMHENDFSKCMITPLKGHIRFFVNATDFENDWHDLRFILQLLNPSFCEECGVNAIQEILKSYQEKDGRRIWHCLGCAIRLQIAQYHPENKNTGRAIYF